MPKLSLIVAATLAAIILAPRSGHDTEASQQEFSAFADGYEYAAADLPAVVSRH